MVIPRELIDVDFSGDPRAGTKTRETAYGDGTFRTFADLGVRLIPRDEWKDMCEFVAQYPMENNRQRIYNQGNEGSCASNMAGKSFEYVLFMQGGSDLYVPVSPMSLYKRVASGPNSGSTIDGNLRELRSRGILPLDTPENRQRFQHVFPHTGWNNRLPDGWEETGKLLRADEFFDLESWEEVISTSFAGFPIGYGRAAHALTGVRPVWQNGQVYLKYDNSWGNWGDNGYGYDSERAVAPSIRPYGAWCLRSTIIPNVQVPTV